MILNIITLIFIIIQLTRCSIVNDVLKQETSYVSKYCPKQRHCREGTHIMCMYYDHYHAFGPRCGNPVNVKVTPKMIRTILANVNDIRGKVATGTEKGKNDEVLPRAYGLMKLEWDKELALLAQVLANQCLGGREDACRATEKFPDPSQTIAVIRYKYPNWEYLKPNNTEKGLNEDKIIFSIDRFLKSTHALKKTVTKAIITSCPRLRELPDVNSKYYLNLVRGGATHIGCGVSAYSKYKMSGDTDSIQNSVQIVCNISDAPKPRQSVYKTIPPIPGQGYTKRCGCPRGYKESRSCLCERQTKLGWKDAAPTKPKYNSIQTTKIMKKKQGGPQLNNQLVKDLNQDSSKGLNNRLHNEGRNDKVKLAAQGQPKHSIIRGSLVKKDRQANGIKSPRVASKSRHTIQSKGNNSEGNHPKGKKVDKIESSDEFSRITNAISPKNKDSRITAENDETNDLAIKFSSHPSSKLQDQKQVLKPAKTPNIFDDLIFKVRSLDYDGEKESITESASDVVKENLVDNYRNLKQKHIVSTKKVVKVRPQTKQPDFKHKKLLSILNSLEQEVNNIKFDDDLKELFDMKMRKIYETGVNKSQETLSLSKLDKQQDKTGLKDLRSNPENENNGSVEDEILTLRRMIHRMSKGTQNDYKLAYAENENNPNQNYNYMDQQYDEYHEKKYVNNMEDFYEDIPSITALTEHRDYHDKFSDILNSRHNVDRQYDDNNDIRDNSKSRNQETFANNDVRQSIFSTAIDYNLDNYDDKKVKRAEQSAMNKKITARQRFEGNDKQMIIDRKGRHSNMNTNVESSGRRTNIFPDRKLQFSTVSRKNQDDDMPQMRLRRPNLLSTPRPSRNQPKSSEMFPSERDTFMP